MVHSKKDKANIPTISRIISLASRPSSASSSDASIFADIPEALVEGCYRTIDGGESSYLISPPKFHIHQSTTSASPFLPNTHPQN